MLRSPLLISSQRHRYVGTIVNSASAAFQQHADRLDPMVPSPHQPLSLSRVERVVMVAMSLGGPFAPLNWRIYEYISMKMTRNTEGVFEGTLCIGALLRRTVCAAENLI